MARSRSRVRSPRKRGGRPPRPPSGDRPGRGEAEEREDEREIFLLRAEWWRRYHGDASGVVSGDLRVQAIAHAERLAAEGLDNSDPGGGRPPRGGFAIVAGRGAPRASA